MPTEIVLRGGVHGEWFESKKQRTKKRIIREVVGATHDAIDHLDGRLALPSKVVLAFAGREGYYPYASAIGRTIEVGPSGLDVTQGVEEALRGLMGHELSHISDVVTNNPASFGTDPIARIVSEGKAEAVAVDVGGVYYEEVLCDVEALQFEEVEPLLAKSKPSSSEARFNELGGIYNIGLTLVSEVMAYHETDIYSIHSEGLDFYRQTLLEARNG